MKSLLEEKIQNGPLLSVFLFAKTQTHTTHTLSTPAVAEYLPATQAVQTSLVCSGKPKNLPAAQAVQTEAPAPEYLPASQAVQTEAPAPEYLPATQAVQTSLVCSGKPKNLPAAQLVQTEAPAAEYLPATHATQVDSVLAPGVAEYLPAGQG
jgi:hypothetical protein